MRERRFSDAVLAMPGAVYSPFADRMRDHDGPLYPLHVGDTWMEPCEGARMEDLRVAERPGMHRYGPTQGLPELVDAIVERTREAGAPCERTQVLVTSGATSALGCALAALVSPGDEVAILAPFWPLIRGIASAYRATPVEVPFYDRVGSAAGAVAAIRERLTPRTRALYVSSPSNPTRRVLPRTWCEAIVELARAEDLWLISDEVYHAFSYEGEHVVWGSLAPERTITAHSFSKTYGMAGNRVGYLAGPAALIEQAHKVSVHTAYHAPVAAQLAAMHVLERGAAWVDAAREQYRATSRDAAALLGLEPPQGSTFLFVDVRDALDADGVPGLLEACFERGVLVAPGASSGRDYEGWIRLCYTSVPPPAALEGVERLAQVLRARGRR